MRQDSLGLAANFHRRSYPPYNLLSLFRSVTQRSPDKREIAWRKLMTVARDALVTATIDALAALRPRTPTTQ